MKAFKFIIPPKSQTPSGQGVPLALEDQVSGQTIYADTCLAVAVAETEQQARELLMRVGNEDGHDTRWLKVARVVVLSIETPCRLAWVEL